MSLGWRYIYAVVDGELWRFGNSMFCAFCHDSAFAGHRMDPQHYGKKVEQFVKMEPDWKPDDYRAASVAIHESLEAERAASRAKKRRAGKVAPSVPERKVDRDLAPKPDWRFRG